MHTASLRSLLNDCLEQAVYPEFDKLRDGLQGVDPLSMHIDDFNKMHGMHTQIEQMQADVENCPDLAVEQWSQSLRDFQSTIHDCDSNYYAVQMDFETGMFEAVELALTWLNNRAQALTFDMRSQIRNAFEAVYSD